MTQQETFISQGSSSTLEHSSNHYSGCRAVIQTLFADPSEFSAVEEINIVRAVAKDSEAGTERCRLDIYISASQTTWRNV